ncbi:MAG TPA: PIG-L deacetylase family protein [Anaerolineales bacterium]|nr:PIG-L deacetylase family protein [Anaerolineales bacterium]
MENNFPNPERVLVIAAHPDDPEFPAAGTIALWTKLGTDVRYVIVTDGSKGSSEPGMTSAELVAQRMDEQRAAAGVLGVGEVVFLGFEDGRVENNTALKRDLVREIRIHRPDVLITHDPTARIIGDMRLNHPDHRATGDAALDAVYPLARDRLNFPEHEAERLEPFKVLDIFLTGSNDNNLTVDITDTIGLKLAALKEHKSQISDPEVLETRMKDFAARNAEGTSFQFAEKFRRVRLAG